MEPKNDNGGELQGAKGAPSGPGGETAPESPTRAIQGLVKALTTDLVKVGANPAQTKFKGLDFPLVLTPAGTAVSSILLQEYFAAKKDAILKAAAIYGAVLF